MSTVRLTLRVSRRALAAVRLDGEALAFHDGRHLPSGPDRARKAVQRYVSTVLGLIKPAVVIVDAPAKEGGLTSELVALIYQTLSEQNIQIGTVSLTDVLASFSLPGLRTRRELQAVVDGFWPELRHANGKGAGTRPFVLEAAAVALYFDVSEGLPIAQPI